MCGIAGYLGPHQLNTKSINQTLNLMKKRGPDHQDYFINKKKNFYKVFLHSRLSIIDLKKSLINHLISMNTRLFSMEKFIIILKLEMNY